MATTGYETLHRSDLLSALASHQTESDRGALAGVRVATMQDFAALAQRRFDAGDISQIELDLAVLANMQARIQQATTAANIAEAKQAVTGIAVGSRSSEWPRLDTTLPALTVASADAQDLVMSLPEVRAVRHRVAAAAARVELREQRARCPKFQCIHSGCLQYFRACDMCHRIASPPSQLSN